MRAAAPSCHWSNAVMGTERNRMKSREPWLFRSLAPGFPASIPHSFTGKVSWVGKVKILAWFSARKDPLAPQTQNCLASSFSKFTFHPWTIEFQFLLWRIFFMQSMQVSMELDCSIIAFPSEHMQLIDWSLSFFFFFFSPFCFDCLFSVSFSVLFCFHKNSHFLPLNKTNFLWLAFEG